MTDSAPMLLQDGSPVHRAGPPGAMAEERQHHASSSEDDILPANTPLLLSRRQTSTG